ncbi:MAG: flagellar export protein FliJ [Planctomycetaceae bacterium]|nr:flagellar export protein FliJ [Planctomycetaceae bacterium]
MFHFRLAAVLRLRLADRDQRRAELAAAERIEDTLLTQADALARERLQIVQRSRALASPGTADIDRLMATHRYVAALRAKAQELAEQLQAARIETERRRLVLVEANRQVRVLQKLREKQQAAHQARGEKQEQLLLDESALVAFLRAAPAGKDASG